MDAETRLLFDITLMLIVAGVCSIVLAKFKLPSIIGYLTAGILLGPYIFPEVVVQPDTVEIFAKIGIVMLMFFIGLELNLKGLRKVASFAMIIAAIEMTLMVVIGYSIGLALGLGTPEAVFLGVTISCASTAVVLGVMKDNKHMDGKLSKAVLGILIMEDIGIVIILAISAPIMGTSSSSSMLDTFIVIIAFIGMSVVIGLAAVPRMLNWVRKHYSGETLFIVSVGIGFGLALISNYIGLSEAIGAFLAGIIVSQATCSDDICIKVEPMKELFMSVFFLSIGLQLDPTLMVYGLPLALTIAAIFITGKLVSVGLGCYMANFKARSAFLVAASMVAMGEFTFVVAKIALDGKVITNALYSSVIGAALVTMLLLPFISKSAPSLFDGVVARMPRGICAPLGKIESMRMAARERLRTSAELKRKIRNQLLFIFVDFVIILVILLAANLLTFVRDIATSYSDDVNILPSILLFIIELALTLPVVINIVSRLRRIAELLTRALTDQDEHLAIGKTGTYKFFRNIGSALSLVLLSLVIAQFLPGVEGLPPAWIFQIAIAVLAVTWLTWDTIHSFHGKLSTSLSKGIIGTEPGLEEGKERAHPPMKQ